ncbi:MAG: hypothetical protein R3F39_04220 [Myxococcota bacterium]
MNRALACFALALCAAPAPAARADDTPNPFEYANQFKSDKIGPNRSPPTGDLKILVIPVSFGTDPGYAEFLPFFDSKPSAGYTFSNFYRRQSAGRLNMETVVTDVVRFDGCPSTTVPDCAFSVETIFEAAPIFEEIFRRIREEQGIRLSDFDRSGQDGTPDGWADGVIVLMGEWQRAIAPPLYAALDIIDDGVQVGSISISDLDRETVLHEYGHNLGAADQYLWSFPLSLMGICDDCSMDVHSRVKLGWADVVDVPNDEALSAFLKPALDGGSVYRLGQPPEYWLVENRQPYRVGTKLVDEQTGGLVVVHVDESLSSPVLGQAQYPTWRPIIRVVNVAADPKRRVFVPGDAFEPTAADHEKRSADNRWLDSAYYDGTRSGVAVTDLTVTHDHCGLPIGIRANLTGPGAADSARTQRSEPNPPVTSGPCSNALTFGGDCSGASPTAPWPGAIALALIALFARRRRALR